MCGIKSFLKLLFVVDIELKTLEIEDIIPLSSNENEPLNILVQGRPKMTGTPRVVGGNLCIVVEQDLGWQADAAEVGPLDQPVGTHHFRHRQAGAPGSAQHPEGPAPDLPEKLHDKDTRNLPSAN